MKLEFSAGGIIYKRNDAKVEFALILDSYDRWTFPKGHIEKGEKPEEAATREVGEEIGVESIRVVTLLEKIDYWFKLGGETIHKYVYTYLMEVPSESELSPQESEIKQAQWFTPEKALEIIDYKKDNIALLEKAFETLDLTVK